MKKILKKIGIGIIILNLFGCSTMEKKKSKVVQPTIKKEKFKSNITILEDREFIPETDIIHPNNNIELEGNPNGKIQLDGVKYVDISKKVVKKGLIYKKNAKIPFTGTFASVIGLYKHYTEEYVEGRLNGDKIWYSVIGTVGIKEPYVDGKKDGVQKTYFRDTNTIRSKIPYSKGKIDGNVIWYNKKGDVIFNEQFKNGTGTWKAYWDNGKIREQGFYKNGVNVGTWKEYTEKGQLEKIITFKKGNIISQKWLK